MLGAELGLGDNEGIVALLQGRGDALQGGHPLVPGRLALVGLE